MPLHVQGEVVRPGERSVTALALERAVARVFSVVTCEFIGSGKLPPAAFPVTVIRLLACVGSQMRLEVRALGVGFTAARIVTGVRGRPFPRPRPATPFGLGLLRQAASRGHQLLVLQRAGRQLLGQEGGVARSRGVARRQRRVAQPRRGG